MAGYSLILLVATTLEFAASVMELATNWYIASLIDVVNFSILGQKRMVISFHE
jgi:hypothetical protein